ncbi:MAG: NAD(P)/FAD-dependent oxidoreductase [Acidimicrobiales bacterium]
MTPPRRALGDTGPVIVVGAGPAGAMLTLYLARQGHDVTLYESRPDLRRVDISAGRSINLALATRGIVCLQQLGLLERVHAITVPMAGRMVHSEGTSGSYREDFQAYSNRPDEVIYSVSRPALNGILLDAAEATGRVEVHFGHRCTAVDLERRVATFTLGPGRDRADGGEGATAEVAFGTLFGCDGSASEVRDAVVDAAGGTVVTEPLGHGYKELTLAAGPGGSFRLEPNALHIWPRGEHMLIALPNPSGDFTVTLFLPVEGGPDSFGHLTDEAAVAGFFDRQFPEAVVLIPDLVDQFLAHPTGKLATIRTTGWSAGDAAVLVGDAAHAIVPFHGQGMNLAFESCRILDRLLRERPDDLAGAFRAFEASRRPNAEAIAEEALDNYVEMRAGVVDPRYLLQRELALELERRYPDRMADRYGMIMFTTMPYAAARERSERQQEVLDALTVGISRLDQVDFSRAAELVDALGPLPAWE